MCFSWKNCLEMEEMDFLLKIFHWIQIDFLLLKDSYIPIKVWKNIRKLILLGILYFFFFNIPLGCQFGVCLTFAPNISRNAKHISWHFREAPNTASLRPTLHPARLTFVLWCHFIAWFTGLNWFSLQLNYHFWEWIVWIKILYVV